MKERILVMKYILTAAQMKESDRRMIEDIGIPSLVLMERAALQCVNAMKEEKVDFSKTLIVCGSGNNGGDGFAIARLLAEEGRDIDVVFVGNEASRSKETCTQMQILDSLGISVGKSLPEREYSVIIDAVFGIGLSRKIEGRYQEIIERMNQYNGYRVAVDIPSGIDADSGQVLGCAFRADMTVTFACMKAGTVLFPGAEYAGKVVEKPIGIIADPRLEGQEDVYYTLDFSDIEKRMPKRLPDSNKGTYGRVLVIAGSKGMTGAAYLSAKAAYLTGAGLVRIYTEETNRMILQQLLPEAVMTTYDSEDADCFRELPGLLKWADVVCLGCGLGTGISSKKLVREALSQNQNPCVIDADGLNLLASFSEEERKNWKREAGQYILTPHMKEMSRLTGRTVEEWKQDRKELLRKFVDEENVVCALKDSRTLVTGKTRQIFLNRTGNAAMAKAGAGDVLAGMISGLMAQKMPAYEAAVLGVCLHGLAGDAAKRECGQYSVLAEDIIEGIKTVLKNLEERS